MREDNDFIESATKALYDNAINSAIRGMVVQGKYESLDWPARIVTVDGRIVGDTVKEWCVENLTGEWTHMGYVFFIKEEKDMTLFTLKWM
jgi:hypothetical protein